jgi:hypothetical protein
LKSTTRSRGYILISLMLFLSLLAIAALAVFPAMKMQAERDREEEMIHRGVQYSRAIKHFYKKFGRYPGRVEELENTNNLRFLRKRYTDPMNVVEGKEQQFKILHQADVQLGTLAGLAGTAGGSTPGLQGVYGTANAAAQVVAVQAAAAQQPALVNTPADTTNAAGDDTGTPNGQSAAGTASNPGTTPTAAASSPSAATPVPPAGPSGGGLTGQTFGGGGILGVASATKKKTIREFCKKNHYNDWKFLYDPSTDLGPSPNTPWCPLAEGQGLGAGFNRNGIGPAQPMAGPQGVTPSTAPGPQAPTGLPNSNQMPPDQ